MLLDSYEQLNQLAKDHIAQFLKEAEQDALVNLAQKANSAPGKEYRQTPRLSLRQRLSVFFF